jgi:hypothetical protein
MATKKDPKQKENQARKPVAKKAIADTSGSNLSDFKNMVVGAAKSVGSKVDSALDTSRKIKMELTGANDVLRFAKNPSISNAAMVALSVAQYAAPGASTIAKAQTAANVAKALPVSKSALIKTLPLGKVNGMRQGVLRGSGEVRASIAPIKTAQVNLMGKDLAATNFKLFETTKSINAVRAGRALNASQQVIQKGKQLESTLRAVALTNAARGTARAMEPKPKKK